MSIQEPEKSADDEQPTNQDTARSDTSLKSSVSNKSTARSRSGDSQSTNKSESRDQRSIREEQTTANQIEESEKESARSEKSTTESEKLVTTKPDDEPTTAITEEVHEESAEDTKGLKPVVNKLLEPCIRNAHPNHKTLECVLLVDIVLEVLPCYPTTYFHRVHMAWKPLWMSAL